MLRTRKSWLGAFETPARSRGQASVVPLREPDAPPVWTVPRASLCDRMEQHWYRNDTTPGRERPRSATEDEIQAFELRNNVRLPADLREYFQRLNGVDMDSGLFRFWPIARIIPLKVSTPPEIGRYFLFADYMVGTWYYAICLGEDPLLQNHVILPDFPSQPVIAPDFSAFVELYLADSPRLYGNQ